MRCAKCRRPMKLATPSGMGPVCARRSPPPPVHERDLLGFNVEKACEAALYRIRVHIEVAAADARMAIKHQAAAIRRARGVWS